MRSTMSIPQDRNKSDRREKKEKREIPGEGWINSTNEHKSRNKRKGRIEPNHMGKKKNDHMNNVLIRSGAWVRMWIKHITFLHGT